MSVPHGTEASEDHTRSQDQGLNYNELNQNSIESVRFYQNE